MPDLFNHETIRTIGLYQPYASLMLHDKIETRWVQKNKKPPFPLGKYLIYSTKKKYSDGEFLHLAGSWYSEAKVALRNESTLSLNGYAIAIGDLVKLSDEQLFTLPTFVQYRGNDPEYTRWNLWFENMQRIKPFPFKGKQGIGFLKAEDKKKIEFV